MEYCAYILAERRALLGSIRWSGFLSLRLNLWFSTETSNHTLDAVLELFVLGGVDERIDAAIGEQKNIGEIVEPVNSGHARTQNLRNWCLVASKKWIVEK